MTKSIPVLPEVAQILEHLNNSHGRWRDVQTQTLQHLANDHGLSEHDAAAFAKQLSEKVEALCQAEGLAFTTCPGATSTITVDVLLFEVLANIEQAAIFNCADETDGDLWLIRTYLSATQFVLAAYMNERLVERANRPEPGNDNTIH